MRLCEHVHTVPLYPDSRAIRFGIILRSGLRAGRDEDVRGRKNLIFSDGDVNFRKKCGTSEDQNGVEPFVTATLRSRTQLTRALI